MSDMPWPPSPAASAPEPLGPTFMLDDIEARRPSRSTPIRNPSGPPSPRGNGNGNGGGRARLRSIRLCEFLPEDTSTMPGGSPMKPAVPSAAQRWAQQKIAASLTGNQTRSQRNPSLFAPSVASFNNIQPDRVSAVEILERWGALRFGGDADTPASLSPSKAPTAATNTATPNASRRAASPGHTTTGTPPTTALGVDRPPSPAVAFETVAPVQTLIDRAILLEKGETLPPEVEAARLRRALAALLADLQQQAVHASQQSEAEQSVSISKSASASAMVPAHGHSRGPIRVASTLRSGVFRTTSTLSVSNGQAAAVNGGFTAGGSMFSGMPMLQINDGASSDGSVRSRNSVQMAYVTANACMEEDPDDPGFTTLNQYVLLDALGAGAQGEVFLATDTEKNELRAIKAVPRPAGLVAGSPAAAGSPMKAARQRRLEDLQREVAIMKRCRHRNVVALYEVIDDPTQDTMYLVMQYVEHGPIASVLQDGSVSRTIEPVLLARYARQICAGLEYLHRHGVVHRDIKPENILLGQNEQVCLADFGVSDALEPGRQRRLVVSGTRGTAAFIAPELLSDELEHSTTRMPEPEAETQAGMKSILSDTTVEISAQFEKGAVDGPAVDVWALGVTLFALLYGKLPWEFEDARDLFNKIQDQPIELRPLRGNGDLAASVNDAGSPMAAALTPPVVNLGASITTLTRSHSRSQLGGSPRTNTASNNGGIASQLLSVDSDDEGAFSITAFPVADVNDESVAAASVIGASASTVGIGAGTSDGGLGPRQTTAAYIASPWVDPVDQRWRKLLAGMLHYDPAKRLKLRDVRRHVLQILQAAQAQATAEARRGPPTADAPEMTRKPSADMAFTQLRRPTNAHPQALAALSEQ